jgi:hypothetical protein
VRQCGLQGATVRAAVCGSAAVRQCGSQCGSTCSGVRECSSAAVRQCGSVRSSAAIYGRARQCTRQCATVRQCGAVWDSVKCSAAVCGGARGSVRHFVTGSVQRCCSVRQCLESSVCCRARGSVCLLLFVCSIIKFVGSCVRMDL